MLFRQSAVSALTRDQITEEAQRLPVQIMPALLGSGEIACGLDATGMQGLNYRGRQYRDTMSLFDQPNLTNENLHLYHDEAVSLHYIPGGDLEGNEYGLRYNLLPAGWFDYLLTVDGEAYDAQCLAREAHDWQRTVTPRDGLLVTAFTLGAMRVTWTIGISPDAVVLDYALAIEAQDGVDHTVSVTMRCHQTLRDGTPVATGGLSTSVDSHIVFRQWAGSTATSTAPLMHPITISWALACQDAASYTADPTYIAVTWEATGQALRTGFRLISGSDRDSTESGAYAFAAATALRRDGVDAALQACAEAWHGYFALGADIHIGDPMKEFLARQQQYVLRAGSPWHSGLPLGTLWTRAFNACTFWDTFFASDGMLRSGHLAQVRQVCDWLVRTTQPEGRPHYWMTYYDGTPCWTGDNAYQNVLAFAGIAIRLYEVSGDHEDLTTRVFPYLHKLATYLLADVVVQNGDGWKLRGEVSGDIDQPAEDATRETGMLSWAVVCLAKCAEYAALLGMDDAVIADCREIDAYFRAHPIDLSAPGMWGDWYPYLTGAEVHVDHDSLWRTFEEKYRNASLLSYGLQPWAMMSPATAFTMTGHPELALEILDDATKFVSGLGYFNEIPPEYRHNGLSPYPPATGSYLSCLCAFFAHGSLWSHEVQVGVTLPKLWRSQFLRWRNVWTLNGACTAGEYAPDACTYTVTCTKPQRIRARIPARIAGELLAVTVNAVAIAPVIDDETILLDLPAGEHTIHITRDLTTETDILLVEPFDHGCAMVAVLEAAGHSVRWVRDYDSLATLAPLTKVIVLHVSYVALPGEVVTALEEAARAGAQIVTLYHAGITDIDRRVAAFTGVQGRFTGDYWDFTAYRQSCALTQAGMQHVPALAAGFENSSALQYTAHCLPEVEVLATDQGSGQPVLTRRPYGEGMVYWFGCGNNVSDRKDTKDCAWQHMVGEVWGLGADTAEAWSDRAWLSDPQWHAVMQALINTALDDTQNEASPACGCTFVEGLD